jgi:hypothetical protein
LGIKSQVECKEGERGGEKRAWKMKKTWQAFGANANRTSVTQGGLAHEHHVTSPISDSDGPVYETAGMIRKEKCESRMILKVIIFHYTPTIRGLMLVITLPIQW